MLGGCILVPSLALMSIGSRPLVDCHHHFIHGSYTPEAWAKVARLLPQRDSNPPRA